MSSSNGYATRDIFLAASQRRYKDVTVAGMKHRIRSLTEGEWSEHQLETLGVKEGIDREEGIRTSDARLIVATVVDADGQLIFKDTDVARLAHCDAGITEPLVRAIRVHCGAAGVEEAKKNSSTDGGDGLPCSSLEAPPLEPATV